MKVHFGQIYIQPGIQFPFSSWFQQQLSDEVSGRVSPSGAFIMKYGSDWELMIRISAKSKIDDNEIRGPTVFKKDKDVEYTIFLPFDKISRVDRVPQMALRYLLNGICEVFRGLDIDATRVNEEMEPMIESICSNSKMISRRRTPE